MRRHLLGIVASLLLLLTTTFEAKATHLMGGEITWKCTSTGEYEFTFKVYRDCSGTPLTPEFSGLIQIHNYPVAGAITQIPSTQWTVVANNDISPNCSGTGSFSCANGDPESVFEYIRTFINVFM